MAIYCADGVVGINSTITAPSDRLRKQNKSVVRRPAILNMRVIQGLYICCRTLFGHTNFQFSQKGEKKVDNSGGLCSMGDMSEGKERIVT